MNEIILLLQVLLLVAGWVLFLRAQQDLKAQAAKQSLAGEAEDLRRSIETLLQRLVSEAEAIERRISDRLAQLETANAVSTATGSPENTQSETRYSSVYALADTGLNSDEIAKQTGMLPGEIELILGIRGSGSTRAQRREGEKAL